MSVLNSTNDDADDSESHKSPGDSSHDLRDISHDPVDSTNDVMHNTLTDVSHDHCYAINGCCVGSEYNRTAEQRSLLDTMTTDASSHDQLTKITADDHTIKLVAMATQEDQGYDTMSSSGSPVGAQDTAAPPLSILEEKIKVRDNFMLCIFTLVKTKCVSSSVTLY